MSNEITPASSPTLAEYNRKINLVEVRQHPEKFPRIAATPKDEAVDKMTRIVHAAFLYRGQSTTPSTIRFVANALVAEILNDDKYGLRSLSWEEIGRVIRNAVLGGAKELYGVNVASLYSALIDYAKTDGHEAERRAQKLNQ
jgi:hypothetical protein